MQNRKLASTKRAIRPRFRYTQNLGTPGTIEQFARLPATDKVVDYEKIDIIESKPVREPLELSLSLLQAVLESAADGIIAIAPESNIKIYNQNLVNLWRIPEEIMASRDWHTVLDFLLDSLKIPEIFLAKEKELYENPDLESNDFLELKDGRVFQCYSQPLRMEMQIVGRTYSFRDATAPWRVQEAIEYQAWHDLLTGLPNRDLYQKRLSQALANSIPSKNKIAVMFLDLDRFKTINDTLGHTIGDRLLKQVSDRLTNCLREGDTIARWGGDEFTLLLPKLHSPRHIMGIAERILASLKPEFHLDGHQIHIAASIGIALYPTDGKDSQTLLKNADAALYRAKEQRCTYRLYAPDLNSEATELFALENSLHYALERKEFILYYQPQVDINTKNIIGVEALVRWQHPQLGMVSPNRFIPLAEETGLIVPIGEWVLRTACQQAKNWQNAGLPAIRIGVNLSARQFQEPNLVETIAQILAQTGLRPEFLELEITETIAMRDVQLAKEVLGRLKEMGVQLSMDDFGTGYSSLNYLKTFPLHTLKLDRAFVRELTVDQHDLAIATAVITLGRGLELRVVAEGVETLEQLEVLRDLHCQEMQGYLFSPPLPVEKVTKLLEESVANN